MLRFCARPLSLTAAAVVVPSALTTCAQRLASRSGAKAAAKKVPAAAPPAKLAAKPAKATAAFHKKAAAAKASPKSKAPAPKKPTAKKAAHSTAKIAKATKKPAAAGKTSAAAAVARAPAEPATMTPEPAAEADVQPEVQPVVAVPLTQRKSKAELRAMIQAASSGIRLQPTETVRPAELNAESQAALNAVETLDITPIPIEHLDSEATEDELRQARLAMRQLMQHYFAAKAVRDRYDRQQAVARTMSSTPSRFNIPLYEAVKARETENNIVSDSLAQARETRKLGGGDAPEADADAVDAPAAADEDVPVVHNDADDAQGVGVSEPEDAELPIAASVDDFDASDALLGAEDDERPERRVPADELPPPDAVAHDAQDDVNSTTSTPDDADELEAGDEDTHTDADSAGVAAELRATHADGDGADLDHSA